MWCNDDRIHHIVCDDDGHGLLGEIQEHVTQAAHILGNQAAVVSEMPSSVGKTPANAGANVR